MSNELIISEIKKEIEKREHDLNALKKALVILIGSPSSPTEKPASNGSAQITVTAKTHGNRLFELKEYLRVHGPQRRGEVIAGSKIPAGTADALFLNNKNIFDRDEQGRWLLKK